MVFPDRWERRGLYRNASSIEDAKAILEKFPLGKAGVMGFDYVPLGPLNPLRIINNLVK